MSFIARLQRARAILEQQGRLSTRALERELEISGGELDDIIEELVDVQQVARREGKVLVWAATSAVQPPDLTRERKTPGASPVPRSADHAEARKVVSIVFADLIGSTSLHERLDAESVTRLMERYYRAMRTAVEAHGGTVVKLMGDGVMAAFGVPRVAEDDAIRAVRAGVAMQQAFRLGLRVGINTGEVVVSADNTDVVGDPVNVAARLQAEAHDGEVVIGESTRRLVAALVTLAPLGSVVLKGRAEAMKAYRVVSLDRPVGTTTATFVGRDAELGRITAVYDAAIAAPAAHLAVLLGSPGLGKSRLIEEFTRRLGDAASVLTAQCDAEGGATFAPLAEALRELLSANRDQVPLPAKEGEVGQPARQPPPGPLLGKEGEAQQPQRGDQPRSRGNAPGGGGAAEDLRAALEAAVPGAAAEHSRIINGITALLAGSPASPEETFFVIRRFLAGLAVARPVVLVIDDLHWAEPLLLDLVEHLVQWGSGVPLLVLVGARPELRDTRSSLATSGGFVTDVVALAGLDAGAATRLAANVIGAADLPAAVAAKVLATSEGNPLFVAELVRMLVQEGALRHEGDRWISGVGLADLEMPPTIHALLAARIERLRPEERTVLERAAVIGRHFSRSAVGALLPRELTDLDAHLEALRRGELIEPDTGWLLGEPVLRFHHVLIRDAAYRRLLKGTRAELHERIANWIEARAPDSVEHDETLGWHLEQAHQFLGELGPSAGGFGPQAGPSDAQGRALGERAARHLAAAGRRALARDDVPVAAGLLGRALDRLDADDPARAELALDWCEALLAAGNVGTAAKAIDELERSIGAVPLDTPPKEGGYSGRTVASLDTDESHRSSRVGPIFSGAVSRDRLRAWHTCFVGQLTVMTAPQAVHATADAVAAAAAALTTLGDAAGEAKAHFVHAQVFRRLGKVGACEAALDRALAAARRAGDRRRANTVLAIAPLAALWGPSPVTRASGRCLDVVRVLRITQGAPAVEAVALSCQAVLEALRGRTDAARRMIASSRKMVEDLGITQRLLEADVFGGLIDLLEGDAAAAERSLRGAYEGLRDLGLGIDAARGAALLARALLAQGRVAEAEELSHESEALAGDDLKAAIAWRGVRAEALAQRGEHAAAVELASKAVEIAAATDALLDHADARLALATALRAAGRGREADAEERRATELWQAKGATLLAERARSDGERVARVAVPAAEPVGAPVAERRRVRPNAATAMTARIDAALAARDFDEITANFCEDFEEIDHPTGSTYGREAAVASLERLFRSRDPHFALEPIATLGQLLFLARRRSHARGTSGGRYDVGAYELEVIELIDVDERGLFRRAEIFAADHLGDAIARLYARYAELLPDGPARTRAAATARSVAVWHGPIDPDRLATAMAPSIEAADHRYLGTWSARGAEEFLRHWRAQKDLTASFALRDNDVLALEPDTFLVRSTYFGSARDSGGVFENLVLVLFVFGADGLLTRVEVWEPDREAEALARFDEVTGVRSLPLKKPVLSPEERRRVEGGGQEGFVDESSEQIPLGPPFSKGEGIRRRVRPNELTAFWDRFDAMFAARDADAIDASFSDAFAEIDHTTGASYGRDGALASIHRLLRSPDPGFRHEALATLGPSLGLVRGLISASGTGGGRFDVGAYEIEEIKVTEVDEQRQLRSAEVFAPDRLGDAVARLYERYAELLPDGPERDRAAARARTAALLGEATPDPDRIAPMLAPDGEYIDHSQLGYPTIRGADAMLRNYRSLFELATEVRRRVIDIVALTPEALLLRRLTSGTLRAGGGVFENRFLSLEVAGPDGLITHIEEFGEDAVAEALARLDELTASVRHAGSLQAGIQEGGGEGRIEEGAAAPPFANAATRAVDRGTAALAARDWEGFAALTAPGFRHYDRTRIAQLETDGREWLASFRQIVEMTTARPTQQVLATRGERLALFRMLWRGEQGDIGPSEIEWLLVIEVDGRGDHLEVVVFDPEDLDAAYAEIDARFDAGEAAAHNGAAWSRDFRRLFESRDWDALSALCAPALVAHDHRLAGWGMQRGPAAWVQALRSLVDLAPDVRTRVDHVRMANRGFLTEAVQWGTRDGGAFEIPAIAVFELDEQGTLHRLDLYDPGQLDQARARFDALGAVEDAPGEDRPPSRRGDSAGKFDSPAAPGHRRSTGAQSPPSTELRTGPSTEFRTGPSTELRTGPSTELRTGFVEGGRSVADPLRIPPNASTRANDRWWAYAEAQDWDAVRALTAGMVFEDRRRLIRIVGGSELLLADTRHLWDSGWRPTRTLLATAGDRLSLERMLWTLADGGQVSEIEVLKIAEVDAEGRIVAYIIFDADDRAAASADLLERYARSGADETPAAWFEFVRAWNDHDLGRLRTVLPDEYFMHDHRRTGIGRMESEAYIASLAALYELSPDVRLEPLYWVAGAAHGRVAVIRWVGTNAEGGEFEAVFVGLSLYRGEQLIGAELFEIADLDVALACFAELGAGRTT